MILLITIYTHLLIKNFTKMLTELHVSNLLLLTKLTSSLFSC